MAVKVSRSSCAARDVIPECPHQTKYFWGLGEGVFVFWHGRGSEKVTFSLFADLVPV